jgi:hypothetical protein
MRPMVERVEVIPTNAERLCHWQLLFLADLRYQNLWRNGSVAFRIASESFMPGFEERSLLTWKSRFLTPPTAPAPAGPAGRPTDLHPSDRSWLRQGGLVRSGPRMNRLVPFQFNNCPSRSSHRHRDLAGGILLVTNGPNKGQTCLCPTIQKPPA